MSQYRALTEMAELFRRLGIEYTVGGSIASGAYGLPRMTNDIDFAAEVLPEHVPALVAALENDYYIDGEMILDAIRHRSSFNVILLETMDKVDVFLPKGDAWSRCQMERRRVHHPDPDQPDVGVYFASAEDVILNKLVWYRMGGGVSDRQWNDVLSVMKVQASALDQAYLRRWARELRVDDLLDRAIAEAG